MLPWLLLLLLLSVKDGRYIACEVEGREGMTGGVSGGWFHSLVAEAEGAREVRREEGVDP